jgi:hypothetical protein
VSTTARARARAGDGEAFRELTEPHRRELHLHCYRMLGSAQDAEDMLQETLLAAWRGLGQFEERASVRSWLYKIATNRCLNALRGTGRRPAAAARYQWPVPRPSPFDWDRPYTRAEWLEQVPTFGGHSQIPPAQWQQLLAGIGAAIDALGGSFTMRYATVAVTAARGPNGKFCPHATWQAAFSSA